MSVILLKYAAHSSSISATCRIACLVHSGSEHIMKRRLLTAAVCFLLFLSSVQKLVSAAFFTFVAQCIVYTFMSLKSVHNTALVPKASLSCSQ